MIDFTLDDNLLNHLRANLKRFSKRELVNYGLKEAAVAITIVDNQQGPNIHGIPFSESWTGHAAMILTRRASNLRNRRPMGVARRPHRGGRKPGRDGFKRT